MAGSPYGGTIAEHFRRPRNYGTLPNASVDAEGANPLCGDRVRVSLALDPAGDRIEAARFTANACAICVASASLLTERWHGMRTGEALALSDEDAIAMLDSEVPLARRRCATLPLEALRRALTTMQRADTHHRGAVTAVLLAAGSAHRFGGAQKLLARVPNGDGESVALVRQSAVALQRAGMERIIVVLGREQELVRASLQGLDLSFATNEAYASGMSSSLRVGVRAAAERWPEATGLLVALGDQPLMDARIVQTLVRAFSSAPSAHIVAPRYRGARGNPVVFARELFTELFAVAGDQGAREVVERDAGRIAYVDFDFPPPPDVDTPDDLLFLPLRGDQ